MNISKVVLAVLAATCAASLLTACGAGKQSAHAVQSNSTVKFGQPTLDERVNLVSDNPVDMQEIAGTDFGYDDWLAPGPAAPYGAIGALRLGGSCIVTVSDSVNPGDGLYEVSVEVLANQGYVEPEVDLPRTGVTSYIRAATGYCP